MNGFKKINGQFELAICVKKGKLRGRTFQVGDVFPILGYNNGVHICFVNSDGDPADILCHNWGHLAPIEIEEQNGTKPPLFDAICITHKLEGK